MNFSNPWIDPRVLQVRPEAARAYLLAHGWEELGPGAVPGLLMFDTPQPRGDKPNVLLPTGLEHPYQVQRLVELVTEVALYEGRYAVEVLNEILAAPAEGATGNGSPASRGEPSVPRR
jgi:hypothetical protein